MRQNWHCHWTCARLNRNRDSSPPKPRRWNQLVFGPRHRWGARQEWRYRGGEVFWVGEEGEGSNSPPRGVPGSAGGPQWLTPPGELFPPAFWQVWLSGLRSLRQKGEVEGWVVSQAQIKDSRDVIFNHREVFFVVVFLNLFIASL